MAPGVTGGHHLGSPRGTWSHLGSSEVTWGHLGPSEVTLGHPGSTQGQSQCHPRSPHGAWGHWGSSPGVTQGHLGSLGVTWGHPVSIQTVPVSPQVTSWHPVPPRGARGHLGSSEVTLCHPVPLGVTQGQLRVTPPCVTSRHLGSPGVNSHLVSPIKASLCGSSPVPSGWAGPHKGGGASNRNRRSIGANVGGAWA